MSDKTVCVDFDGVIHSYSGTPSKVDGKPIDGAFDFLNGLLDAGAEVIVFSARASSQGQITR